MRFLVSSRKFIVFSVLCFFPLAWWSFMFANNNVNLIVWKESTFYENDMSRGNRQPFVMSTSGCRIPAIDPFDPLVRPLIAKVDLSMFKEKCGKLPPLTSLTPDNTVVIDRNVFGLYGISNATNLECRITAILNNESGVQKESYHYSSEHRIFDSKQESMNVTEDHLRVRCHYNGILIYTDFYATVQIRPELEERSKARFLDTNASSDDRLSVLILTLDSVSRVNVHRQMPLTAKYLVETMGAVEMLGYNKLGDNTFPILVTLLMGLSAEQVKTGCGKKTTLDSCPFIWKEFSSKGYRTAFGEDSIIIAAFSGLTAGFVDQPTDYCLRPTMLAEYESVKRTPWNQNDYYCFAKRVQVPVLMQFVRDFAWRMRDKPHFGYFHTSGLTHDDMNWAQLVDPMVHDVLLEGHQGNYFNNSVLMLMSDHGARFGPIRETYIGKLEESLPFLYLVFPPWFVRKHPMTIRNLRTNANRLMSSYDIHETLKDILHARYDQTSRSNKTDRMSLFYEIPETRTCSDANIPEHYCACQTIDIVRNDSPEAIQASEDVVSRVNELTRDERKLCAKYTLAHTVSIYSSTSSSAFSKDKHNLKAFVTDYTVTVTVTPGSARFEATVRFRGNESVGVLGDVSRVTQYGTTSACITDSILRKYCWCLQQLMS